MNFKLLLLFAVIARVCFAQGKDDEFNTLLMKSTFMIQGPAAGKPGFTNYGTGFLLAKPTQGENRQVDPILITAAHVLDEIEGDQAIISLHNRRLDGAYDNLNHHFYIRNSGKPLYSRHPSADVAAMYIDIPPNLPISVLTTDFLVDDKRIEKLELHPEDGVFCLGFPLAISGPGGFPLPRAGRLGSYPLTPMKSVKEWVIDMLIFPGNSGGPVYFYFENRLYGNLFRAGAERGVLGLVTEEIHSVMPLFAKTPLAYGIIVPAEFIRDTMDLLPSAAPPHSFVRPNIVTRPTVPPVIKKQDN
jgi:hypothetical protein